MLFFPERVLRGIFVLIFRLHLQLMDLQQKQIDELADWLTVAEKRINSAQTIGSDLDTVRRQVEDHKVMINIKPTTTFCKLRNLA